MAQNKRFLCCPNALPKVLAPLVCLLMLTFANSHVEAQRKHRLGPVIQINCGGPAVAPFLADQNFTGGVGLSRSQTVDLSEASNPAPAAAYQTVRFDGNSTTFTYTFANLTPATTYTLRLHLAETLYSTTGHLLNVTVNGTTILSNFDIFGVMGTDYKAIVQSCNVTTDVNGTLAVHFQSHNGAAEICAIEVLSGSNANPLTAPTGINATIASGQVTLNWSAVAGAANYIVQSSGSPTGPFSRINSALVSGTTFKDMAPPAVVSYYRVLAVNASGVGLPSTAFKATILPYQINCGGSAVVPFLADQNFTGGIALSRAQTVDLSEASNPAPATAYQTLRYDGDSTTFTYTFANLTPATTYTLRLHLAETLYSTTGHLLNVTVNGAALLSSFDILGVTGSMFKAIVQSYNVTTDVNGTLAVHFQSPNGAAEICAIEVLSGSNANSLPAPTGINATIASGQVTLNWNAVAGAASYIVQSAGSVNGPFSRINSALISGTTFKDTAPPAITAYYRVIAVNASGAGAISSPYPVTILPYQINCRRRERGVSIPR